MKTFSDLNSDLISQKTIEEMEYQRKLDSVCSIAIKYLGISKKSSGRIKDHLKLKGCDQDIINEAMCELERRGYIDDLAVARTIVRRRSGRRAVSKSAMRLYLEEGGVPADAANCIMFEVEEDFLTAIYALRGKYDNVDEPERIKMIRFLLSRGYNTSFAARMVDKYLDSNQNNDNNHQSY